MTDIFKFNGNILHDIDMFSSAGIVVGCLWILVLILGVLLGRLLSQFFLVEYNDGSRSSEPIFNLTVGIFTVGGIPFSFFFGLYLFAEYDLFRFLRVV
ncbi:hypothetical protein ACEWK1_22655 [Metabacillus sp. YM-086]|uniref:hypothetical protein n=1 Tax=Metabacillus sp. YM-086 TaxID=3341729 RepID=UPI003A888076